MKQEELVQGNLAAVFARYAAPGVAGMLGVSLYILADTFFIAGGVGSGGLAALNIVIPFYSLVSATGLLIGTGAATQFAIRKGRADGTHNQPFTVAIAAIFILAAVFTTVGVLFTRPIGALLGGKADTMPYVTVYLRTFSCFAGVFAVNNVLLGFVRNDGSPRRAMCATLASSLSNILLDYLFIFPLGWGMFGAALATGLSALLSTTVLLTHFFGRKSTCRLVRCKNALRTLAQAVATGLPSFVTELSSGVVIFLFNWVLLKLSGTQGVAAYGVVANLSLVCASVFTGVGQGAQPLISVNFGAGKHERVRRATLLAAGTALVFGGLFLALGLCLPQMIAGLFVGNGPEALMALTTDGVRLYSVAFPLMGVNIALTSAFAAMNRPWSSFALSLLRGIALVLPALFLLASLFGTTGVWLTIPASEAATLLVGGTFAWRISAQLRRGMGPKVCG